MTTLLYLMACLMSPAPLLNLAESRDRRNFVDMLEGFRLCLLHRDAWHA
jgi:hypothetical protein